MHSSSRRRTWLRLGTVATGTALVAAACGSSGNGGGDTNTASAPGITATTITLGTTQPLTGPAAPGYSEISAASQAMFKWQNAHGGVFNRSINLLIENDQYNPALTATATRKLVLQDNVFADFDPLGTPTQLAVQSFLNTQKVPQLFIASGCACWNQPDKFPWSFGWQPNYIIEGKILGKYINDTYAGQKVGYIYQDDEFGQDGIKGLDQQVPGANVVGRQTYDVTTLAAGLGNQVGALKAAGAKVVAMYTIPAATSLALLAAATIGYHPTWVVSSVGADPPTLTGLLTSFSKGKAGVALLNGVVSEGYLPPESADSDPWITFLKSVWTQYDQGQPWDGNTEYGLAVGLSMIDLLKAAGRNPTRQSIADTLESQGQTLGGPGLVPLSYSKTDHYGFQGGQIAIINNGAITPTGPVYVATNDGSISTTNYKAPAPPS